MEDMEGFRDELSEIEAFSAKSTIHSLYIAGILRNKTSMKLPQILQLLTQVEELSETASANHYFAILFLLYQGKTREAVRTIDTLNGKPSPVSQRELVQQKLQASVEFEEVVVKGKVFAKNLFTGVVTEVSTAQKLVSASQESINAIEHDLKLQKQQQRKVVEADRVSSEELARKLQYEFDQEGSQEAPLQCMICLDSIKEEEFLPLESCGHMFHSGCVLEHIETLIEARTFPVSCPFPDCKLDISVLDLTERLSPELQSKYHEYSFATYVSKNLSEVSCCPTPDCKYVFVLESTESYLNCPVCENEYCVTCRADWHDGYSCEEYRKIKDPDELDKMFETFVNGQNFKKCPHCHFWVEKTMGCDHMACRCGNHFCYRCGGDFGKCLCIQQAQRARRARRARRGRRR
jgi:ariadne-1